MFGRRPQPCQTVGSLLHALTALTCKGSSKPECEKKRHEAAARTLAKQGEFSGRRFAT